MRAELEDASGCATATYERRVLFHDSIWEVLPDASGGITGLRRGGCHLGRRGIAVCFTGRRGHHAVSLGDLASRATSIGSATSIARRLQEPILPTLGAPGNAGLGGSLDPPRGGRLIRRHGKSSRRRTSWTNKVCSTRTRAVRRAPAWPSATTSTKRDSKRHLAEAWNGSTWSVQKLPKTRAAEASTFFGVSCTSATACTAVGAYLDSSGVEVSLAEAWNGTLGPSRPLPILLEPQQVPWPVFHARRPASASPLAVQRTVRATSPPWSRSAKAARGPSWPPLTLLGRKEAHLAMCPAPRRVRAPR